MIWRGGGPTPNFVLFFYCFPYSSCLVLLVNSCFCYEHGVWQRWAVKPASATKYAGTTNGARNFPNFPIFLVKPKFMFN